MQYDNIGNPLYETNDLIEIAYKYDIEFWEKVWVRNTADIIEYNTHCELLDLPKLNIYESEHSVTHTDEQNQKTWFIDPEYKKLDIYKYCLLKCKSQNEIDRVDYEYKLFERNQMIDMLRCMVYIVNVMEDNDIISGVGRGSSVSSFILYLIGIHKINPIIHELDCNEFFKTEKTNAT